MDHQGSLMTRVVLVGSPALDLARLVPTAVPEPIEVAADPGRDELAGLSDVLTGRPGEEPGALAVVPVAHAEPAVQRLRTAASALGGRPVPIHVTSLPPLGVAALGALAAVLGRHAPAGVLAGAMGRLEAELVLGAVLRSTAGLTEPRPTFGMRLRSLLPSTAYAVRRLPDPELVASTRTEALAALAGLLPPTGQAIAWTGRGEPPSPDDLADLHASVLLDAPDGLGASSRRSAQLELVAFSADLGGVTQRVLGLPAAPCPWCGEPAAATPCPQCGHLRNPGLEGALA